jgi:hypothetical protein
MSRRDEESEIREEYQHGDYYHMTEREQLAYQRRDDDFKRRHPTALGRAVAEFFGGKPNPDNYKR